MGNVIRATQGLLAQVVQVVRRHFLHVVPTMSNGTLVRWIIQGVVTLRQLSGYEAGRSLRLLVVER